jgi:uncharacterized protein YfaT (DUF1175 family)
MVELRVIEGGLGEIPRELLNVVSHQHEVLAGVCEKMAASFEACPPDKLDAWLVRTRRLLRRMAQRFQEDVEEETAEMPEFAAWSEVVRANMRLCVRDIAKAEPGEFGDFAEAHRHAAKRFSR